MAESSRRVGRGEKPVRAVSVWRAPDCFEPAASTGRVQTSERFQELVETFDTLRPSERDSARALLRDLEAEARSMEGSAIDMAHAQIAQRRTRLERAGSGRSKPAGSKSASRRSRTSLSQQAAPSTTRTCPVCGVRYVTSAARGPRRCAGCAASHVGSTSVRTLSGGLPTLGRRR